MSGLAKLLTQMGHSLTGSDLKMSTTLAGLDDLGVEVWSGSRPEAMAGVDLVVMGTVTHTGIAGFFIGTTAEDVLRQVDCSVLTVKPEGFESPVRLDD